MNDPSTLEVPSTDIRNPKYLKLGQVQSEVASGDAEQQPTFAGFAWFANFSPANCPFYEKELWGVDTLSTLLVSGGGFSRWL
eukprot:173677-Amphidinium_carterae.1